MPPKRQKSGQGSAHGAQGGGAGSQHKWESGLIAAAFNDDDWKSAVALVVPSKPEDRKNITILQEAVAAGSRRLFSSIELSEMYKVANELGNPKQKKEKNTPPFFEVNELVKQYLDNNEPIPIQVMARLIKWHLLSIKAADIKQKEDEKKNADKSKAGGKAVAGKKGDRQKSAPKGGGGGAAKGDKGKGAADVPPAPRKESKLRKRGEEDDDSKYIDDEPDDGPQHYVMIFGQSDALLVQALSDVGVYVDVVLEVKTDSYDGYDTKPAETNEGNKPEEKFEEQLTKAQLAMIAQNELERAEREKLRSVFEKFWFELPIVLKQAPSKSKIRDTVHLEHLVEFESIPRNLDLDFDERGSFGVDLFETAACVLYDMFDWKRQYYDYLDNTHFQNIPEVTRTLVDITGAFTSRDDQSAPAKTGTGQTEKQEKAPTKKPSETPRNVDLDETLSGGQLDFLDLAHLDLNYYDDLLNSVPSDCVSVELVMHCMLEQVECLTSPLGVGSTAAPREVKQALREDGLDAGLAQHLSGLLLKLALSEEEKKAIEDKLASHSETEKEKMETKLVNFKDSLSLRLQSLKAMHGFDPKAAEEAMLSLTPSAALLNYPQPSIEEQQNIAGRFQEVMMHCAKGSLSQAEINHALKQFIFECIQLRETDDSGLVVSSGVSEDCIVPWDDPYPFSRSHNIVDPLAEMQAEADTTQSRTSSAGGPANNSGGGGILKTGQRAGSAASSKGASVSFAEVASNSGSPIDKTGPEASVAVIVDPADDKISEDGASLPREGDEAAEGGAVPVGALTRSFSDLANQKLRNLDEWCYVERFDRNVFIQVLEEAKYQLPFVDAYYCRKDNTLLITLYNPVNHALLSNHTDSFSYLHTDVGFRNYLDYIREKIEEWTEEQEQKYLAALAEKERLAAMSPTTAAAEVHAHEETTGGKAGGKRSRSQSPKGGAQTGRKGSGNRSKSPKGKDVSAADDSEDERDESGANKQFMRPNSMKQWKLEQDKIKEAEENKRLEKEKAAAAGGGGKGKASGKKGSPAGSRDGSRSRSGSRAGSRSPSKERKGKKGAKGGAEAKKSDEGVSVEKPEGISSEVIAELVKKHFNGYNLGDDIVHCSGRTSGLFPCDGAQVRVETTNFAQGSNHLLLTLLEGANVLNLHIGEPKEAVEGETEVELQGALEESACNLEISVSKASPTGEESTTALAQESTHEHNAALKTLKEESLKPGVNEYGSFSAKLSDGIALSFSTFGESGLNPRIEKALKCIDMKAPVPPTPVAAEAKPEKGGSAKGKKGKGSAGKKGGKNAAAEPATPPPATPPGEKVTGDGGLMTRGTDATGVLGHEDVDLAAKKGGGTHPHAAPNNADFQQLHVSAPNGLTVNFFLEKSGEDSEEFPGQGLMVEQSYPFKTKVAGPNENSTLANSSAWKEKTRYITNQGNVIKILENGKIEVLCADGTRMEYNGPWVDSSTFQGLAGNEDATPRPDSQNSEGGAEKSSRPGTASKRAAKSPTRKGSKGADQWGGGSTAEVGGAEGVSGLGVAGNQHHSHKEVELHEKGIIGWSYVTGIGEQLVTNSKGEREKTEPLKYYTASDPETMEVLMMREDRVMIVSRPDNSWIVDHNDGTRITTFHKEQHINPPPQTPSDPTAPRLEGTDHDEDGGLVSSTRQVRFVKVECEGFATLVFNTEDSSCTSFFGSHTNLFAHPSGLYVSSCADGSAIVISQKGQVVYVRKPDNEVIAYLCNCDSFENLPEEVLRSDVFILEHDSPNILKHTDPKGNLFTVKVNGETAVTKSDTVEESFSTNQNARYFVVNPDQSGEELLRHNDIMSLLQRAEEDPSIVVLVDPLPEQPNVKGVSVMQPSFTVSGDKWIVQKDEKNIIPKNLTSRDLKTLPPKEYKKPGPKFGTSVGRGLSIGAAKAPKHTPPQEVPIYPKMPDVVALRQFVGYPEVKPELRSTLKEGLKSYCASVEQRKAFLENSKKSDPRSKEEIEKSLQLERKMNERFGTSRDTLIRLDDASSENPFNSRVLREKTLHPQTVIDTYRAAIKAPSPPAPVVAKPKRTHSAWGRDKAEIEKEFDNRKKLRNKEIPPYFQSYLAENFVAQQKELKVNSELEEATKNLPFYAEKQRQRKMEAGEMETSQVIETQEDPPREEEETQRVAESSEEGVAVGAGQGDQREKHEDEVAEKQDKENASTESFGEFGLGPRDQKLDSQDRKHAKKLPARTLNKRFMSIEDSVKRKANTTSVAGAVNPTHIGALRGFLVRPTRLNFGVVREGYTYGIEINLKNIGLENCRFRVRAPPLSSGLTVNYRPPGAVAAGMSQQVELVLFALANPKDTDEVSEQNKEASVTGTWPGSEPDVIHELLITTEVEIFTLPVTAQVLPADEYDSIYRPGETGVHGHSQLAAILSTQPVAPQNPLKRSVNAR